MRVGYFFPPPPQKFRDKASYFTLLVLFPLRRFYLRGWRRLRFYEPRLSRMNDLGKRKRFLLSLADSSGPLTRSGSQSEHRIRLILPPSSEPAKENKMK